jgi:hypothetical protein
MALTDRRGAVDQRGEQDPLSMNSSPAEGEQFLTCPQDQCVGSGDQQLASRPPAQVRLRPKNCPLRGPTDREPGWHAPS